jgi:pimeloyl-ACP methyl ester carboxylesterase/DNA-binding transcriptional ArsR family regulator
LYLSPKLETTLNVSKVSRKIIKRTLRKIGLTDKEAEIYIFLAKHGVLSGGEISKQTKMHRPLVYRILKKLEKKGLVESTLESPIRFFSVPFEKVLDENIKMKYEEASSLEKAKNGLLSDWEKIGSSIIEPDVGKFFVIKGNRKIYSRIAHMIRQTEKQFSAILTVPELVRNEQFGVFDAIYTHPLKSKIKFQFLTDLSPQNLEAMKLLNLKLKTGLDLKATSPSSSFILLPRMVIRDKVEGLFFISPKTSLYASGKDEICICTNNPSLVQALKGIFKELLRYSVAIEKKIFEIETGKLPRVTHLLDSARKSRSQWLIFETIQYYLKALNLMKDHKKWAKERTETFESLGALYGLTSEHERANEFYQKGIANTDNEAIKSRMRKKIRRKKIVENNGTKLVYYVYGEGKKTILLLAWISTAELWIPQITYFSQNYKVITVDMRGTGESDKPPGEYTVDLFTEDVEAIIDDLPDDEIVFVGLYVGGMVGIKYVTNNPGRISKLVLVNMGPKPMRSDDFPYGMPREKISKFYVNALKNPAWGVGRLVELWFQNPEDEHIRELLRVSMAKTPPEIIINTFINYNEEDVRPLLKEIKTPTLIVESSLVPKIGEYMRDRIPGSKLYQFKIPLFPNLFEPEEFNKLLEDFMSTDEVKRS